MNNKHLSHDKINLRKKETLGPVAVKTAATVHSVFSQYRICNSVNQR